MKVAFIIEQFALYQNLNCWACTLDLPRRVPTSMEFLTVFHVLLFIPLNIVKTGYHKLG